MTQPNDQSIRQQAAETLASGLSGLQFKSTLEQHFASWHNHRYLPVNRMYLLAVALILALVTIADRMVTPEITAELLTIRGVAILFVGLVFIASHVQSIIPRWPLLLFLVACIVHVSLLVAAAYAAHAGYSYYQGGTIIGVIFAALVLKLRLHYVLPLALLLWFSQVIGMHFLMAQPFEVFIEVFVVFTVVTILSIVVSLQTEYEVRNNFLNYILLVNDQSLVHDRSLVNDNPKPT